MREFRHQHVLRLIGIVIDSDKMPLVILPFMTHGDLLSYIRDDNNVSARLSRDDISIICIILQLTKVILFTFNWWPKIDGNLFNPLIPTLKPQSNGPLYSNTVIGTLAIDGWVVTFGTAGRGLRGLGPRPVPSSLYQM